MNLVKTLAWLIAFTAIPSVVLAEDLLWEGKIYRDVKIETVEGKDKKDRMVILRGTNGYVKVPYKRLNWVLQKEADTFGDNLDLTPEKMIGRKWLLARHVRDTEQGALLQCRAPDGQEATADQVGRGRVFLRNFSPPKDYDKDNIKVLAWSLGRPLVGERKSLYVVYDMNPPVLIGERSWTDKKGRKLKASLAAANKTHVVLVRGGKPVTLAKELLSPADIKLIEEKTAPDSS